MATAAPTPPSDPERFAPRLAPAGAVLGVVGGCAGGWAGLLLLVAGLALLLAACRSRDGLLLLGPFVRFELVRAARARRLALWRVVYAVCTALLLLVCVAPAFAGGRPRRVEASAEAFFLTYTAAQFAYLVYLTGSLLAPIVAEEREAKRWDFLLATDLRSREVLFGKAAGRLPMVLDPVLASLPILAASTFFGGVSPRLVVLSAAATVAAVLGTAGVAFFYSVFSPTAKQATERTFGLLFGYVALSGVLCFAISDASVWHFPTAQGVSSPVEVGDVVEAVNAGNPVSGLFFARMHAGLGADSLENAIGRAVRRFAAFHLGLFLVFGLTAVARLRTAVPWVKPGAAKPAGEPGGKLPAGKKRLPGRPPVGDQPVYWWERYGGLSAAQLAALNWLTPRRYVMIGLLALGGLLVVRAADPFWVYGPDRLYPAVRMVFLFALWMLSWACTLAPAFRAARAVARERAAGTLDDLRLTALTPRDILYEKWLAAVRGSTPVYLTMVTLAAAGVAVGAVHPLGLVGLAAPVPVFAGAAAAVGLYFSVRAASPTTAVRNITLLGGVALYVVGAAASRVSGALRSPAPAVAAFPPAANGVGLLLGFAPVKPDAAVMAECAVGAVAGMAAYAGIGWVAWRRAVGRFDRERHD